MSSNIAVFSHLFTTVLTCWRVSITFFKNLVQDASLTARSNDETTLATIIIFINRDLSLFESSFGVGFSTCTIARPLVYWPSTCPPVPQRFMCCQLRVLDLLIISKLDRVLALDWVDPLSLPCTLSKSITAYRIQFNGSLSVALYSASCSCPSHIALFRGGPVSLYHN